MARLGRRFFARPVVDVARDLVGCELRGTHDDRRIRLRIVEVEAYLGVGQDPASHAHRGPTPRTRNMFETPGRLYVYVSYGLHHCLNVVCERPGVAGAVLLRAAEPIAGIEIFERRRGRTGYELTNGPGKLGQALGADLAWDGLDLVRDRRLGLWPATVPVAIAVSGRIGISQAVDQPLRFYDSDSPWVSRARPSNEVRARRNPQREPRSRSEK